MRTLVLNFEALSPALLLQTSVVCLVEPQLQLVTSTEQPRAEFPDKENHSDCPDPRFSFRVPVQFPRFSSVSPTRDCHRRNCDQSHNGPPSWFSQLTAITACPRLTDGGRNYPWEGLWLTPRVRPRPSGNPLLERRLGQGRSSDELVKFNNGDPRGEERLYTRVQCQN